MCAHTLDDWLDEPRPRLRVLGARRAPLAHALSPDESQRTRMERSLHRLRRRPRGGCRERRCPAARRAAGRHRLSRAQPAVSHRPPRPAQARIAGIVDTAARARGLRTDISTRHRDTKYGDAWFEFLASGRCVIGTESGSSALDPVRRASAASRPSGGRAPGRHLRAVLGPAGAGLGRLRLHGHQPAPLRGGSDEDVPAPGRRARTTESSSPRRTTSRCARLVEPRRGARAHRRPGRDRGHGRARLG